MTRDRRHLTIFGSRSLSGVKVYNLISTIVEEYKPTIIITSAKIKGVCEVVRNFCEEKSLPLLVYFADPKYHKGMYKHRSDAMIANSDYVLLIHDGESKGTANELAMVKKTGIPHSYHKLPAKKGAFADMDIRLDEMDDFLKVLIK